MADQLKLKQSAFETLSFEVLTAPDLPSMRGLALETYYGTFLFALERGQAERLEQLLAEALAEWPKLS